MGGTDRDPAAWPDEQAALRMILEGTASETGERFFMALVENLARALGTHGAWVTEYLPQTRSLRALAFRLGDRLAGPGGPRRRGRPIARRGPDRDGPGPSAPFTTRRSPPW